MSVKYTDHHVPPQCYGDKDTFILRRPLPEHQAYHILLGVPRTLDEAQRVAARKYLLYHSAKLHIKKQEAFRLLFGAAGSITDIESILRERWWTRKRKGKKR